MSSPPSVPLSPADVRRVAVLADVHPRTVDNYLAGKRATYANNAEAIGKALRKLGRVDLVRSGASAAA